MVEDEDEEEEGEEEEEDDALDSKNIRFIDRRNQRLRLEE